MSNISQALKDRLIPWATDHIEKRIVIAQPKMRAAAMPAGAHLCKRPLCGKRVIVKGQRLYHNTRGLLASWPDSGLNEISNLKMACVLAGVTDFQIGGYALQCGPGYFIAIPPGTPHPDGTRTCADVTKSSFCEILYFRLLPNALQCWISRYGIGHDFHETLANLLVTHAHLTQLFRIMMEEMIEGEAGRKQIGEQLLTPCLHLLQNELEAGRFQNVTAIETGLPSKHDQQSEANFPAQLQHYIESHLHARPTLEGAAREMFLSRAQFARRVRQETGRTFGELVSEHRPKTVKAFLQESDWTVSVIATLVGYRAPHYLHQHFKRETGLTPIQYRRKMREKKPVVLRSSNFRSL